MKFKKNVIEEQMDDRIKIKQNFETLEDKIDFRSLYSKCRLEILASEIKQKKHVKFNIKNNVVSNYLY